MLFLLRAIFSSVRLSFIRSGPPWGILAGSIISGSKAAMPSGPPRPSLHWRGGWQRAKREREKGEAVKYELGVGASLRGYLCLSPYAAFPDYKMGDTSLMERLAGDLPGSALNSCLAVECGLLLHCFFTGAALGSRGPSAPLPETPNKHV